MKRLCGAMAVALLAVAGCGGDTCNSQAAQVNPQGGTCALAPNASVTINVRLCPQCTDTSPSCQAELVSGNTIEVSPVVQQCQSNQGCDITQQCQISPVSCPVNTALQPGSYTASYIGPNGALTTSQVVVQQGASSSCTL